MGFRVALLGIYHESNTFIQAPTTLGDFENGHWLQGTAIRKEYQDAHHEIGGMLEVFDDAGIQVAPVMFADATPGGTVSSEAYQVLLQQMLTALKRQLPVDGCMVVPHGAGVSGIFADMDGHWLSQVREILGENIPIVGTLDPHANISPMMVTATNALISYKTNPHIDQRDTGREAARLMINILRGKCRPIQTLFQLPLAISIEQQHTGAEPCKSLYAFTKQLSNQPGILSISILLGFPYADTPEMGSAVLVISDNDPQVANETGNRLKDMILQQKKDYNSAKNSIDLLLPSLNTSRKPVLMLDMGDNIGGGAPGNNTSLLRVLSAQQNCRFFICIWDPAAVAKAATHAVGDSFRITISEYRHEKDNYSCEAKLIKIADGKFRELNPRHGGQVNFDMGTIAIVQLAGGGVIMFTSLRALPFSLKQLTTFDIDPAEFDVIVAKGVNAPLAAYAPVCATIMQVDTPGVTQADMTRFHYQHRRRPMYPFEED